MPDVSIDRLGQQVTVIREASVEIVVHGKVVPGVKETFSIQAVVTPTNAQQMLMLPEGERTEDTIALYTTTQLLETSGLADTTADQVLWQGRTYRVVRVMAWGNFWECLATRVGR